MVMTDVEADVWLEPNDRADDKDHSVTDEDQTGDRRRNLGHE